MTLYILMEGQSLVREKNKNRWKFLKVLEDEVFAWERMQGRLMEDVELTKDEMIAVSKIGPNNAIITTPEAAKIKIELTKMVKNANKILDEEGKKEVKFTFNDREIFSQARLIFESIDTEKLKPDQTRAYEQIDEAFAEVETVKADN